MHSMLLQPTTGVWTNTLVPTPFEFYSARSSCHVAVYGLGNPATACNRLLCRDWKHHDWDPRKWYSHALDDLESEFE